jgi:hypothetical protein
MSFSGDLPLPASQDPELGFEVLAMWEKRERPISINMAPSSPEGKVIYRIYEATSREQSRVLRIGAYAAGSMDDVPVDTVVIDPEPLLIARIRTVTAARAANGELLAEYTDDADGASEWTFRNQSGAVTLTLPPQAIGEEMIKGNLTFPTDGHAVPMTNELFDFRLSPAALLDLDLSDVDVARPPAPWSTRRLFSQRLGVVGVQAKAASFELVYGLRTEVRSQGLRIADTDAFIGRIPFPDDLLRLYRDAMLLSTDSRIAPPVQAPSPAEQTAARQRSHAVRTAGWVSNLFRRPAQLTVFRDFTDRSQLTIDDAVTVRPRTSRDCADPFQLDKAAPSTQSVHSDGREPLRGGVDFMFESPNIAQEYWIDSKPGRGALTGLCLGTLGGSGTQHAAFNNGKTLAISATTHGRLDSLTLIRIGRIAMTWHRARHVIVYERSTRTAPRYQAFNGKPADQPDNFEGLAAMRKVREYVEITQPLRQFPDTSTDSPINGPLLAMHFNTVVIPVKPEWGCDVDQGWLIALRGPLLAEEEPYYPFPKIFAELAQSEGKGGGHVNQQLNDPGQLCFFTSTNPKDGGDTDGWPAWPGVDYPLLGRPTVPDDVARSRLGNAKQPDAPRHDLGQRNFTIDLLRADCAVNLMHGRPYTGIDARISNICLARGLPPAPLKTPEWKDTSDKFGAAHHALGEAVSEILQHVRTLAGADAASPLVPGAIQTGKEMMRSLADQLSKVNLTDIENSLKGHDWLQRQVGLRIAADAGDLPWLGSHDKPGIWKEQLLAAVNGIANTEATQLDAARTALRDCVNQTYMQMEARVLAAQNVATIAIGSAKLVVTALKRQADEWLQRRQALLLSNIDRAVATGALAALRDQLSGALQEIVCLQDQLLHHVGDGMNDWFATASGTTAGRANFDDSVDALVQELEVWLRDCLDLLDEVGIDAIDDARAMLRDFDWPSDVFGQANDWIANLEADFADQLDARRQAAMDALKKARDDILTFLGNANLPALKSCQATLQQLGDGAQKAFSDLRANIDDDVNNTLAALPDWQPFLKAVVPLEKLRGDAIARLNAIEGNIAGAAQQSVSDLLAVLEQQVAPLRDTMHAIAGKLEAAAALQLGDWRAAGEKTIQNGLELTRVLATGPLTDTIVATRDQLGYYYNGALQELGVTKASAIFNRMANDALNSLGIELPFDRVRDRLLPQLSNFPINELLPRFAGMDMSFLLRELQIPDDPLKEYDWIKLAHGFDKDRLMAWAQVHIDKQFAERAEMFTISPLTLALYSAHFVADSRMELGKEGNKVQSTNGTLTADWILELSGRPVLTIRNGALHYDSSGGFKFDMNAEDVELDESLHFITTALSLMETDEDGVLIRPMLPAGVRATMDLPLPDIGTGAFTLTSLALFMHFDLLFTPEFELRTGLWLSKPERPFGLAVLFLGGGGWFGVDLTYRPPGNFMTRVSIGISAGAFAALNFGVARGSAGLLFTAGLDFYHESGNNGSSATAISIGLLMWGEFSICCVASAYLRVTMRVTQKNGEMTGYGEISVSIRICWCFTLNVSSPIAMPFKGESSSAKSTGQPAIAAAAPPPTTTPPVAKAVDAHFANLDL